MRNFLWAAVIIGFAMAFLSSCGQRRDPNTVQMYALTEKGIGVSVGTVRIEDGPHGLLITPDLKGLPPGLRGFHVHEQGSCAAAEKEGRMVPGLAAGGHYDPAGTNSHKGPYSDGHLGDLPALFVDADGRAALPVLAPRLKLSDAKGRALVVHAGSDNYSDTPEMGGGGERIACGVVPD
jgi:superoxide dismutase, Cu-Zn family